MALWRNNTELIDHYQVTKYIFILALRPISHTYLDKCQKGEVNLRNSFGSIVKTLIDIAGIIAPTLEMSEQAFRLLTQLAEIPYRHPEVRNDDKQRRKILMHENMLRACFISYLLK